LGSNSQPGHFINTSLGEFEITSSGNVNVDFAHPDQTFENHGLFIKTGTGTSNVDEEIDFDNAGTVTASAGILEIRNPVNLSGGALSGGAWTVNSPGTLRFASGNNASSLAGGANVLLNGPSASFTSLNNLATIENGASLSLSESHSYTSGASSFTLGGSLTVNAGSSFSASGDYLQQSEGSLTMMLQSASETPAAISGMAMLSGQVTIVAQGFDPMKSTGVTILAASGGVSGQFTSATLPTTDNPLKQIVLGYLPTTVVLDEGFLPGAFIGEDGSTWFDPENWGAGELPSVDTDVRLPVLVLVDGDGAVARDVTIMADGGGLLIDNGNLTSQNVIAEAASTLTIGDGWLSAMESVLMESGASLMLNHADALLSTHTLTLEDGAMLDWLGGTIEIDGGMFNQPWDDLIVGETSTLSTLRLLNGASTSPIVNTFIGVDEGTRGMIEVSGSGSTLAMSETLFVGFDGEGTLEVTGGGEAVSSTTIIGDSETADGSVLVADDESSLSATTLIEVGGFGIGALGVTSGAEVTAEEELFIGEDGFVWGDSVITADVMNTGEVAPGTSAGVLFIDGTYEQSETGVLSVFLAGFEPGVEFSVLDVLEEATLDGTVFVEVDEAFLPEFGDVFEILVAEAIVGEFVELDTEALLFCNEEFGLDQSEESVMLEVVETVNEPDLTGDGVVNVFDLLLLLENWGECDEFGPCPADLNGDCTVNIFDLLLLLENWG
ncbi:MAG: hypothetical protein EA377_00405, partial [Phycisphaerales bacterium]